MNITLHTSGSTSTIFVRGKFDGVLRKDFNEAIRSAVSHASSTQVEVHLGAADYIDCCLRDAAHTKRHG